ncbi:hypothetical protein N473_26710 [Pseudoalteromonas luteoviolacea CPMOR-1]|uniref:Uncharacterized protein n=2 Tax=Pseudoalteromonas luteoviolacea TaxID=43657 RepID=A0A167H6X8_9GAMM|nr:hypothetical protein N473_26710 [Pseudoalteromonas luteoviolacea CPMOR-1]
MKLIGSKMELDFREELITSRNSFKSSSSLKRVLESNGHSTANAIVLHHTPDQTEDIYLVLINGSYIISVELDRYDQSVPPILELIELKEYKHGLSRMNQVRLLVAQDILSGQT